MKFGMKWLGIPVLALALMFMGDTSKAEAGGGFSLSIGGPGGGFGYSSFPAYGPGFGYGGINRGFGYGGIGYGGVGFSPYSSAYRGYNYYPRPRVNYAPVYGPSRSYYRGGGYGRSCR